VRKRQALGCVMALLFVMGLPAASHAQVAVLRPVPDTSCTVFPADNIWNSRVDALPVHPEGAMWLAAMHAGSTNLHPDFGPPSYGLPYDVVSNRHRTVRIKFQYASESDRVWCPLGPRTPIENGSDRHALIVNKSTCTLYELFDADWNRGNPPPGAERSSTCRPTRFGPTDGPRPMRRVSPSSPAWLGSTRSRRERSATPSGSPRSARGIGTCGRLGTTPEPPTSGVRPWAPGSV
jgi:hypothetical protein